MFTGLIIGGYTLLAQAPGGQAVSGGGQLVTWAVVLFGMAAALFIAEMFVPSGGLLGAGSVLCLIGGVVMLFWIDDTVGLIGMIVSLLAIPVAFLLAIRVWPSTPIGRALTLGGNDEDENSAYDGQSPRPGQTHAPSVATGTVGKTLTELRPVGTCLFDGERHECLSEAGVIHRGVQVKVVSADGMQVKVRPADEG
jgi:membrane-bound ClpP family serine protease